MTHEQIEIRMLFYAAALAALILLAVGCSSPAPPGPQHQQTVSIYEVWDGWRPRNEIRVDFEAKTVSAFGLFVTEKDLPLPELPEGWTLNLVGCFFDLGPNGVWEAWGSAPVDQPVQIQIWPKDREDLP